MSNATESFGMHDPQHPSIPISAGIPPILRWAFVLGVILVVIILGLVVSASFYGHVWPSTDAQKIRLEPNGKGPVPAGVQIGQ